MKKKILLSIAIACLLLITLSLLYSNGYLRFNYPKISQYPVRGIDVSHHQGKIEWNKVKQENIHFVYIKATEGGDFKDLEFKRNWNEASKVGLLKGAYHFFYILQIMYITYDSYDKYLKGNIGKCKVWIRDVFFTPDMPYGLDWTFWQYADHGRVNGINGPVDLNVFYKKELSDLRKL